MDDILGGIHGDDLLFFAITAAVAAISSLLVFSICFYWFRREQRLSRKIILNALAKSGRDAEDLFLTGDEAAGYGELVAQFKVNHGKQVVSLLESHGKRFIHVDGPLSASERARMVRYLKSEGFMS